MTNESMLDELQRRIAAIEAARTEADRTGHAYSQQIQRLENFGMGAWLLFDDRGTQRRGLVISGSWANGYATDDWEPGFHFEVLTTGQRRHMSIKLDQIIELLAPSPIDATAEDV